MIHTVKSASKQFSLFSLASLAALLSGAAALSYEVLWTRRLTDLTGGDVASVARVIGCFFMGLALGAAAMAWWGKGFRRPWRMLAVVEILIAAASIPVLTLPLWGSWIWASLGPDFLISTVGGLLKTLLSIALVMIPAMFMGTSLPLMIFGILDAGDRRSTASIQIYAVNTIGGAGGIALVMLATLKWFGVAGALLATMGLNLVAAAIAWQLDKARGESAPAAKAIEKRGRKPRPLPEMSFRLCLGLSFLSGFLILGFEMAAIEMLMLVVPMSLYAPAIVLICVITCLAVGAFLVAKAAGWFRSIESLLPGVLALAGVMVVLSPVVFMSHAVASGGIPPASSFASFLFSVTRFALISSGAGLLLLGLAFPLVVRATENILEIPSQSARQIAALLAVNGLGGLLGAEVMFRFLLPMMGIHLSIGVIGGLAILVGIALAARRPAAQRFAGLAFSTGVAVVALTVGVFKLPKLDTVNPHMGLKVIDQSFGREGTLAVVEHKEAGRSLLVANQYLLGSVGARSTQERQAHVPLLLHPAPADVAFIGVATGITPGAALLHDAVKSITAMEISESVIEASRDHFSEYNHDVMAAPQVQVVRQDGRTYLGACSEQFDVVIGDLFLPWGAGVGRLYSQEHFLSVRDSLKSDGLFCQWLPMYQLTPEQFQIIQNTFVRVFPNTLLFCNSFQSSTPALALIGWKGGGCSPETVKARCDQERRHGKLRDPLSRHGDGLALLHLGMADAFDPSAGVNTLDNMRVELDAGRVRVVGAPGSVYYFGSRWVEFVEARSDDSAHRGAHLVRAFLEAERARNAAPLRGAFASFLPENITADPEADWNLWEGPRPDASDVKTLTMKEGGER